MTTRKSAAKKRGSDSAPGNNVPVAKLWIVLRRAYQSIVDFLESGIIARGASLAEFVVLEALLHKGDLTAGELSQKTRLTSSSIDLTLVRLREKKFIKAPFQQEHQKNKAAYTLTKQARTYIEWLYVEHEQEIASIFASLSTQQQFDLYRSLRGVGHTAAKHDGLLTGNPEGGLTPWQLRRTMQYMRLHAAHPVTVREIATSIKLSDSHFSKAFKLSTGLSPYQWLLKVRIGEAQKLLQEGVVPLSKIALLTGFGDQSHFSRTFQKLIGVSPKEWRRVHALQ